MPTYRIEVPFRGATVLAIKAVDAETAAKKGEKVVQTALDEQREFAQYLHDGDEVEHVIFGVDIPHLAVDEVGSSVDPDDSRIDRMARAYAQDVYGIDMADHPEISKAARKIARRMLEAADDA